MIFSLTQHFQVIIILVLLINNRVQTERKTIKFNDMDITSIGTAMPLQTYQCEETDSERMSNKCIYVCNHYGCQNNMFYLSNDLQTISIDCIGIYSCCGYLTIGNKRSSKRKATKTELMILSSAFWREMFKSQTVLFYCKHEKSCNGLELNVQNITDIEINGAMHSSTIEFTNVRNIHLPALLNEKMDEFQLRLIPMRTRNMNLHIIESNVKSLTIDSKDGDFHENIVDATHIQHKFELNCRGNLSCVANIIIPSSMSKSQTNIKCSNRACKMLVIYAKDIAIDHQIKVDCSELNTRMVDRITLAKRDIWAICPDANPACITIFPKKRLHRRCTLQLSHDLTMLQKRLESSEEWAYLRNSAKGWLNRTLLTLSITTSKEFVLPTVIADATILASIFSNALKAGLVTPLTKNFKSMVNAAKL